MPKPAHPGAHVGKVPHRRRHLRRHRHALDLDGDQLLWELRAPRSPGAIGFEGTDGSGAFGRVSYTHAGGIDRPLVITKGDTSIVPHQNWRGQFAVGTYADGPNAGRVSDCGSFPA